VQTYTEVMEQGIVDRVIIVDDASRDDTVGVARTLPNAIVFSHAKNLGYGGNQKSCYRLALEEGRILSSWCIPIRSTRPS